jgi:hypothetical protein
MINIDIHKNVIHLDGVAYHYTTEQQAYDQYTKIISGEQQEPTDWLNALECSVSHFNDWVSKDTMIDDERYLEALEGAYKAKYNIIGHRPCIHSVDINSKKPFSKE